MKIVFLTPYEQPTGQTSRNYDFAKRLVQRGHKVTLLTNNFCHRTKKRLVATDQSARSVVTMYEGARVVWLNTVPYFDNGIGRVKNALSFVQLALLEGRNEICGAKIVIADSVPPTTGLLAWYLCKKFSAKFIYQIRDVWPIALVYDGAISKLGLIYWVLRGIEIFLYRSADVICSSVRLLGDHVRKSGVKKSKIVWIPNGVDLSRFPIREISSEEGSEAVRAITNPFRLVYTGGFGNAHDVLTIVKAANIVSKRGYDIVVDIYGDGPKRDRCEQYCFTKSITCVNFFGSVPRGDIPDILAAANALVVAVTDSDAYSFGINFNKLYDYLAAGRPVIFSCRSFDNPVRESGAGYSVSPECPEKLAAAIIKLISDGPGKRAVMGARGRGFAEEQYDIDVLSERFEQMLKICYE